MQIRQLLSALVTLGSATAAAIPEAAILESIELATREPDANLTELAARDDLAKRNCVGSAWHVDFTTGDGCQQNLQGQFCDPARYNVCQGSFSPENFVGFGAISSDYRLSLYSEAGCHGTVYHLTSSQCMNYRPRAWKVWKV